MAYIKTTWANGTTPALNATNLNKMETGIDEAHDDIAANTSDIATNTSSIATNTADIAANVSDISDLDADKAEFGDSVKIVQDAETIQTVIDSCPVAVGNLKDGFTNPYVVKVPPGHEKEYYSLVRNASDAATDKRNVKVVFEDNPDEKFIIDQWDNCDSTDGWTDVYGDLTLSIDTEHHTEGSGCIKIHRATAGSMNFEKAANLDLRKYQGIIVDVEVDAAQLDGVSLYLYDDGGKENHQILYPSASGTISPVLYFPLVMNSGDSVVDYSSIVKMRLRFRHHASYVGAIDAYLNNIRFIRTFPTDVAVLRYDDGKRTYWNLIGNIESRGWRGNFAMYRVFDLDGVSYMTLREVKSLSINGHNIVNHTNTGDSFIDMSDDDTYYNFMSVLLWMKQNGLMHRQTFWLGDGTTTNEYAQKLAKNAGVLNVKPSIDGLPVLMLPINDPDYVISTDLQRQVDGKQGGITELTFHILSNESNYVVALDWLETHFSKVITFSELAEHFPSGFMNNDLPTVTSCGRKHTLATDHVFRQEDGFVFTVDPGGAARNYIPAGEFQRNHKINFINIADAAETLTFDPTFNAAGAHDGADNADTLTDSGESWIEGQLVGRTVNNTTDGSAGVITANTGTTVTAILSGGTDDDWDIGDTYTITPAGLNQAVAQNERGIFVYDGSGWLNIFVG